jgi:hypothetical protein
MRSAALEHLVPGAQHPDDAVVGVSTAKKTKANTRGRDGTLHDANRATLILIPDSLSLARVPLGRGRVGDHWGRPQTAPGFRHAVSLRPPY